MKQTNSQTILKVIHWLFPSKSVVLLCFSNFGDFDKVLRVELLRCTTHAAPRVCFNTKHTECTKIVWQQLELYARVAML